MRKRTRVLILAAIVAAFVVPVSFAWSIDSNKAQSPVAHLSTAAVAASTAASVTSSVVVAAPATSHRASPQSGAGVIHVPDSAKLLLIGTVLFGLAAFVRRAI
jgi:hypothetical protein